MTRLAVISDVHADVHSLDAALQQITDLGCDQIVCAGDLVDFGLFPEETISRIRERQIPCVRGNHDHWAVGDGSAHDPDRPPGDRHDATGFDLTRAALQFLAGLPRRWAATIDGVRVVVCHGSPTSDMDGFDPRSAALDRAGTWLALAHADILVVGHTHVAFEVRVKGGGLLVNPGALMMGPGDPAPVVRVGVEPGDLAALPPAASAGGTFGVLDVAERQFRVHRARDGAEVEIARTVAE